MDNTGIEWTDDTWNPLRGCSLVSDGCRNCYAMGVAGRFSGPGMPYEGLTMKTTQGHKWTGKITLVPEKLHEPLYKTRPRLIFVNSMSDLFHEDVPESFIDQVFAVMALSPQHTFQVLTKRAERMRDYCKNFNWARVVASCTGTDGVSTIHKHTLQGLKGYFRLHPKNDLWADRSAYPLPNVWLGVSVEDQKTANERIPALLETPAAVRWLSMEPLLSAVSFRWASWVDSAAMHARYGSHHHLDGLRGIDWVVVGGESGPNARPMHAHWARALRDQCAEVKVPFLFKQWGEWLPDNQNPAISLPSGDTQAIKVGKKAAGRLLDGVQHDGYPGASK